MANLHRGEIDAEFDGKSYTMCLTLGALAELEAAFGDGDLLTLTRRFESGRLSAGDTIKIIGAGLRGGGNIIASEDISAFRTPGGAAGYIDVVARLLQATFTPAMDAPEGEAVKKSRDRGGGRTRPGLPRIPVAPDDGGRSGPVAIGAWCVLATHAA